jgi:hypothetical protein
MGERLPDYTEGRAGTSIYVALYDSKKRVDIASCYILLLRQAGASYIAMLTIYLVTYYTDLP